MAEETKQTGATTKAQQTVNKAKIEPGEPAATKGIVETGKPNLWKTIYKERDREGKWVVETRAMDVHGGCIVRHRTWTDEDGNFETMCYVPGVQTNSQDGVACLTKGNVK